MGGRKKKSRRLRLQSLSNDVQHITEDGAAGLSDEDEEALEFATKLAKKRRRRGKAHRKKGRDGPEDQIRTNIDTDIGEKSKQPKGFGRKNKSRQDYAMHEGATEKDEDNSEYHSAEEDLEAKGILKPDDPLLLPGYLFEEDNTQEDEARNKDMERESDLEFHLISRHLEEMKKALDSLEGGEENESAGAYIPDDQQEKPELRYPAAPGSIEPIADASCSESNKPVNSVTSAHDQASKCIPGLEDNNTEDGIDTEVPKSADLHKEKAVGDTATSVDSDGPRAEVEKPSQVAASGESAKTSAVTKSKTRKWGIGTVINFFLPRGVEDGNVPLPESGSPREIQEGVSDNQLSAPKNLERQQWLIKSTQRFELRTLGYTYDGEVTNQKMHGYGRLTLRDGDFIAGNWDANRLVDLKSCQLHYRNKTFIIVKRFDDYLLTIYENHFVAIVMLDSIDQLDFMQRIGHLKDAFFEKLTTLEILQDELQNKRQESLKKFESWLRFMTDERADAIVRANVFNLLRKYSSNSINRNLNDFLYDRNVPPELKNAAENLRASDSVYLCLNESFTFLKERVVHFNLRKTMAIIYKDRIQKHREMLISNCSGVLPSMKSELQNLDDSKIAYVTKADVDVFDQLARQPFFQHYKDCIENLVKRFGRAFNTVPPCNNHPSTIIPIMSPVLEFLVRSLWEIISEIVETADGHDYESVLRCDSGDWKMVEKIKWPEGQDGNTCDVPSFHRPSENKSSRYHKSLEVQCRLILDILKHVFPDSYISNKRLNYKFFMLGLDSSERNGVRSDWFPKGVWKVRPTGRFPERFKDLSEERLVWLYILDHTIHEVFKDDLHYEDILKHYDPLLQGQVRFIESSPAESQESFRALTHNVVKLVTSSAPYFSTTAKKSGVDGEVEKLGVDVEILFQQISTASQCIDHDPLAFSNFRDLITEYNKYLSLRHCIEVEAAPGYFSIKLSKMMQTFMRIVGNSLKKSVPTSALVVYFRCLNDFLDDFRNIDFLGMWYIKTLECDNQEALEKVDNKLSTGALCSYRVTNIEDFVAKFQLVDRPPPHHYIIQIVSELLGCIEKSLDKQWQSGDDQLQLVQLKATGIMLEAVRRSFMYLKEQPDYVDFKAFKKESIDPFVRLVEECLTLDDLKNRADIVKESFWYLRKMDEIDIDQAMILLRDTNTCQVSDKLLTCYNLYLSSYNEYIETYTSCLSDGGCHTDGLSTVKLILKQVHPLHFSQWTEKFKNEDIPILLAGLSAIWSILVSKDVSSTGKFLKPHCIQILCILRLLSVDQSQGTDSHLAQVLTGQGKSVILGLLSALLALTGHKVRVMCYSKYLSTRDQNDFEDFFQTFRIHNKINYGTFKDMAEEFLNPTCNGVQKSLRQMVRDKVLNHTNWSAMGSVAPLPKNTVLLIDEVDVFFMERFYGNTSRAVCTVGFEGLAVVQEKIWSLAMKELFTRQQIVDCIKAFIRNETAAGNTLLSDLSAFLSEAGTFSLLKSEGGKLIVKNGYTNQTLFDEHLLEMTDEALTVATVSDEGGVRFMINTEGIICGRNCDDKFGGDEWCSLTQWGYRNTFSYLRLKGSNYDHKGFQNYGYLRIPGGRISYSRLPSQFRLILGVSGTIKNLGEYEKSGIKSYNIHNTTILPSFYGESNLLFNQEQDFYYYPEEQAWLKKVYHKANAAVQSSRAALIFFESDLTMNLFTNKYRAKFDRFNEITINTEPCLRDTYIEEAGLPGAVTLATRGMGRGVDYKSSLSVEKHGGVHVIQTFYSTDIKEEVQIKGRTARKDNKGSYEIVICKEHLVKEKIIPERDTTAHTYATLDEIRQKLSSEKGKTVTEKIKQSEGDHETTMKYFGLA